VRRLVVIDAANFLYRAFFAIPPLRSAEGFPTNAVYGFANMLRKVMREEAPDAVVVAMDPPGPSFRKEISEEYKATRDAQPEDLSPQIPVALDVVRAHGIPILEVPGFEADDVIATLVHHAPDDLEVVIVSTDKDLMQLVGERVVLVDTMKDKRIGPEEVEERFGVRPAQVLDLRALVGDPSDNIPGVKGIGEKGAAKLLAEWGDLETLLAKASEVKAKKAREALETQADAARLSKRLATLRDDAPLEMDLARLPAPHPDPEALAELYRRLGFTRLLEELRAEGAGAAPAREIHVETRVVEDAAALEAAVAALAEAPRVAVALAGDATPGGLVRDLAGVALAGSPEEAVYVPLRRDDGAALAPGPVAEALAPLLAGPRARPWVGRGTKRIQTWMAEQGAALPPPAFDVEIAAFLREPSGTHTTPALAGQLLGRSLRALEELTGRGAKAKAASALATPELAGWAGEEAAALLALEGPLRAHLEADGLLALFEDVELPLTAVLSGMERAGVRVDEAVLAALSAEYEAELARIEGRIFELAGERFTVGSPKQLQVILFEKLKLPVVKRTKTGYSTDEGVLEQLAAHHELPAEILAYRRLAKLKSTYVDALPPLVDPATGRIHPTFHQTGAATGRLSSSHPNVQNIPIRSPEGVRIREAFVPAEGRRLLSADYSQVELRILAHFSGDESLIEAFRKGEDIHRRTAAEVAGIAPDEVSDDQRAHAKAINFGIIYGSTAFGIANQLKIAQAEAQETIDRYFRRYRGVRRFLDGTVEKAREEGFVRTLLGRRRYLPDLRSRNRVLRQAAERMAVNSVIQGTAADLIKKAMVEVDGALRDAGARTRMILQVHDELVFEVPDDELASVSDRVRELMEAVYALDVPLRVELGSGRSWREAH
jgi:DNA polymerase-1